MPPVFRFALPTFVICCAFLLPAGPAAAIDVCGNGVCHTTTIPPETPENCPDDCGGGPSCQTDYCENGSCSQPPAGIDYDGDGMPDRLEYDLAHKFFPSALLQWHEEDRSESYLYKNRSTPYTLRPYIGNGALCDTFFECLEIRWGITFFYDHGDVDHIGAHQGDSEMYAALLRRNPSWTGSQTDPAAWEMIRDFTSAHWGGLGDSSMVGAYGDCPEPCGKHTYDARTCNARPTCMAIGYCSGYSGCSALLTQSECSARNCVWNPSCVKRFDWSCYRDVPMDANTTLFCAEGKHALYHSDDECDGGGWLWTDDCPSNAYDLRDWKGNRLQNVGNANSHAAFDTKIQSPGYCGLYDVWGGAQFGDATSYLQHFTVPLHWALY